MRLADFSLAAKTTSTQSSDLSFDRSSELLPSVLDSYVRCSPAIFPTHQAYTAHSSVSADVERHKNVEKRYTPSDPPSGLGPLLIGTRYSGRETTANHA